MKISILTTIANPEERQDKWIEALTCYLNFADEVIVVNGGNPFTFREVSKLPNKEVDNECDLKFVNLEWPQEWNWVELPRHLNAGRKECTGDWIIKTDIDQFFHEKDFKAVREKLAECPQECQVATFQKMSMTYGKKYYQKGGQPIAFRNNPEIAIGQNLDKETDLCFPIKQTGYHIIDTKEVFYEMPQGKDLPTFKTGISYWNYDSSFKTADLVKKEFWRFSRAYYKYFKKWKFGNTEEKSFQLFKDMMKSRHERAPYTYSLKDHPKYIRKAIEELKPEQFAYNGWVW
jgi:hypothetical protein